MAAGDWLERMSTAKKEADERRATETRQAQEREASMQEEWRKNQDRLKEVVLPALHEAAGHLQSIGAAAQAVVPGSLDNSLGDNVTYALKVKNEVLISYTTSLGSSGIVLTGSVGERISSRQREEITAEMVQEELASAVEEYLGR